MTVEDLKKANELKKEMDKLNLTIGFLANSLENYRIERCKKHLRFFNRNNGGATILLFNGISSVGEELPVDNGLVEAILVYCKNSLNAKKEEFEKIGKEEIK